MINTALKRVVSPLLDPVGNRILAPPLCGLWGVRLHGDRSRRRIALTFDDGPVAGGTESVMETLGDFGVPGTFFCLGVNTAQNPQIAVRAITEGHVIGNHSMEHSRIAGLLPRYQTHFRASEAIFQKVLGRVPRLYRSPWGWSSPWEVRRLRRHGLEPIGWDVYFFDDHIPAPRAELTARNVLRAVRPGSIVLFHDGMTHARRHDVPETVRALQLVIPALRAERYEFVTVPDLLGVPAYKHQQSGA